MPGDVDEDGPPLGGASIPGPPAAQASSSSPPACPGSACSRQQGWLLPTKRRGEEVVQVRSLRDSVKEGRHTRVGRHWGRGSAAAGGEEEGEEEEAQTEAARPDAV
jgi:hypothetical protein